MSMEALNAVCATFPTMRAMLASMAAAERPSYEAAVAVSLHLANKHRSQRGYANESIGQIADDLGMSERKVRRVLKALDDMGLWVAEGKGNQHAPTKRTPAFLDPAASSGKRTEQNGGASSGSRTEHESEHRPVSAEHRPVPVRASSGKRTTPPIPHITPRENPERVRGNSKSTAVAVAPPTMPAIIQSAPDLARMALAVIAQEAPELPIDERQHVTADAAQRWLDLLARTPSPTALADAEGILRWALHHKHWAGRISGVRTIADNWTAIVRDHRAAAVNAPAMSTAQRQNLALIADRARKRAASA